MKTSSIIYGGCQVALGLLLSSCSVILPFDGSDHNIFAAQRYFSNHSADYLPSLEAIPREAFTTSQAFNWWENLGDSQLNYLVNETLVKSYDARRALLNVEQSEAILKSLRADLLPSIGLQGQLDLTDYDNIDAGVGLEGNWDLDLFGQTRESVREAQTNVFANQTLVRDVRRLVLAQLVQTYISYRTVEARIDLNQSNLERLQDKRGRINRLVDSGYSSRLDLDRADTQISQIQSNLAALEAQKTTIRNALALLVQAPPSHLVNWLDLEPSNLSLPDRIVTPRLDYVVRHRPDIRAAEWSLVSATHGRRAAQLALVPDITLGGNIFSVNTLSNFTDIGNVTSSIVASIAQPLLGRGRLLAGVDFETTRVKQAWLDYEEAVISAALDIDTALNAWNRRQEQLQFDKKSLDTAVEAQSHAQKLFFAGQESFTSVVVAENTRLAAEERYLLSRQAAFESYINYSAATVPIW